MTKFVMMYCNIWTSECWKALHQPKVVCTRLGRALSIHPGVQSQSYTMYIVETEHDCQKLILTFNFSVIYKFMEMSLL